MSERDFQNHVIDSLARLETQMESVRERLDKLNGRVGKHDDLFDAVLEGRIRPIEEFMIEHKAEQRTSLSWLRFVWPFLWATAGVFGALAVRHGRDLLEFVK